MEKLEIKWEIEFGFKNEFDDFISYENEIEFDTYEQAKKEFDNIILNTPNHNDYACLWKVELLDGSETGRDLYEMRKEEE